MKIPKEELIAILSQFNPWWRKEKIPDLPSWKRAVFNELLRWMRDPPAHRAVLLSGPRQVGKTTLLLQTISRLLEDGVSATNIIYITFDHPIFKLAGLDAVLEAWRELEPRSEGPEYLFLDEAQFIRDFGTWIKHQIDFSKKRRILFTGSASPLAGSGEESGVGRWHTVHISTLSFYEYLQIKKIHLGEMPKISTLTELFDYPKNDLLLLLVEPTKLLIGHFHEYLVRGGFPQTALVDSIPQAQRLLREDIIDKVLKRDMTAIFGVRRILELEQTFIYLCMHDGGIQDLASISNNLGVPKPTVQKFINLLEAAHLLYRLPPFGYGKEILRARYKLYLADPAISSAILMKGKSILEDSTALGNTVETAVFGHIAAHSATNHSRFSYWKDAKNRELDLIIERQNEVIPIEIKYQSQPTSPKDVQGLINFFINREVKQGYVLTKAPQDVGKLETEAANVMKIPSCLFCYWIGEAELLNKNILFT